MKIIRPTEVTVTFESAQEASRFLYAYYANADHDAGLVRLGFPLLSRGDAAARADQAAAVRAAVRHLAEPLGETVPALDKEHAAPTYISGNSDRVYLISEMPTRYIVNVLNTTSWRAVQGLENALRRELAKRGEQP